MNTETNTPAAPRRRFGVPTVAIAMLATGVAAGGGTWLAMHPGAAGGHDHAAATGEAQEQWQCPMHPAIVQDHPGDCPICGMKLVKVQGAGGAAQASPAQASATAEQWQCPMHPSIVQDHPGDCPICGMKLVKVAGDAGSGGADAAAPAGLSSVTIDAARQQLIGLRVAHAELGAVGGSFTTSGRVAVDETRVHHVNVKFSGFMEEVYADFVGRPVKKGERLFSIYSPELLAAQDEYLLAVQTRERLGESGSLRRDGDALVDAARRKLELWDVPRAEMERLDRTGEASRTVTFRSPANGVVTKKEVVDGMRVNAGDMPFEIVDLSRVWVLADAYESDLRHVALGQRARLTLKAFPNRTFEGRVAFIDPVLDPKTRTAKVRVEFPNPTGELKPEMFGEVVLEAKRRDAVRIPADAVIHTGTTSVVFVALGDGKFQPREVKLGEGDSKFVEVVSGVEAGEGVVTRANFLIDSESRLRASLAALSAGAPAPQAPGEHVGHGGSESRSAPPPASEAPAADPHAAHRR